MPPSLPFAAGTPSRRPSSPAADEVEVLYIEHRTLLLYVGLPEVPHPGPRRGEPDPGSLPLVPADRDQDREHPGLAGGGDVQRQPPLLARAGTDRVAARRLQRSLRSGFARPGRPVRHEDDRCARRSTTSSRAAARRSGCTTSKDVRRATSRGSWRRPPATPRS